MLWTRYLPFNKKIEDIKSKRLISWHWRVYSCSRFIFWEFHGWHFIVFNCTWENLYSESSYFFFYFLFLFFFFLCSIYSCNRREAAFLSITTIYSKSKNKRVHLCYSKTSSRFQGHLMSNCYDLRNCVITPHNKSLSLNNLLNIWYNERIFPQNTMY